MGENDKTTGAVPTDEELHEKLMSSSCCKTDLTRYAKNLVEKLQAEKEEIEMHYEKATEAFVDNNKEAYNEGFAQGQSYQAICEVRGRSLFLDDLREKLCDECRKKNITI